MISMNVELTTIQFFRFEIHRELLCSVSSSMILGFKAYVPKSRQQ